MSTKKQRFIHRNANAYRNKSSATQTGTVLPTHKKVVEISPDAFEDLRILSSNQEFADAFEELRIEFENNINKEKYGS